MDQPISIDSTLDIVPTQTEQESQLIKRNVTIQQIITLGLVETRLNKNLIAKIDVKSALESFLQSIPNFSIKMGGVFLYAVTTVMKKRFVVFSSDIRDFYDNFLKSSIPKQPKALGQNKKQRNIKKAAEDIAEDIQQRKLSASNSYQMINEMSNQAIDNPRFMSKPNEIMLQEDFLTPLKFNQQSQNNSVAGSDIKSTDNFRAQINQSSQKNFKELSESLLKNSAKQTPVSQSNQNFNMNQDFGDLQHDQGLFIEQQSWGGAEDEDREQQTSLDINSNLIQQMDMLLKEKLDNNQFINTEEQAQDESKQNKKNKVDKNQANSNNNRKNKKFNKWIIDDKINLRDVDNQQINNNIEQMRSEQKVQKQQYNTTIENNNDIFKDLLDKDFLNNIEEKFKKILNIDDQQKNNQESIFGDNQQDYDYNNQMDPLHNSTAEFTNINEQQQQLQEQDDNDNQDKSGQMKNISDLFNITNNQEIFKQNQTSMNNALAEESQIQKEELNEKDKKEFQKHEKLYLKIKSAFNPRQKQETFQNIYKKIKIQKGKLFYELLILQKLGKINLNQKDKNLGEILITLY